MLRFRLRVPSTSPFFFLFFFWSGTFDLFEGHFDRVSVQHILPIKVSATIDSMLKFDGDFDGHGDGDVTRITGLNLQSESD